MKKFLLTFLILLTASSAALASEAKQAIRQSHRYMASGSIGQHTYAVKALKAALLIPGITQEEITEINMLIPQHNAKIEKLKNASKLQPKNETAYSPNRKPSQVKKENPQKMEVAPEPQVAQVVAEPVRRNAVLNIKDLVFSNELHGDLINEAPFYASDMRYLYGRILYDGPSDEVEKRVYVKLYDPQGNLKRYNDGDDYTFTQRVTFYPYDDIDAYLAGTGNAKKSIFIPGVYRYEMWMDDSCVISKNVEINLKEGETSVGTARIQSVNVNPKSFSVSFDVTIAAQNLPNTALTTKIAFFDTDSGAPIPMTGGGDAVVERTENILYDEAVLTFSMNMPYSRLCRPKGWSGSVTYIPSIVDAQGNTLAQFTPGTFTFTQN